VADNQRLVAQAVEDFGRLDIFVANAGLTMWGSFLQIDEATWDTVVDLNLKGSYFGAQAAARQMIAQRASGNASGGRIVFSSSVTGVQALPNCSAYAVTKAALRHMATVLALELGRYGITVNTLGIGATVNERNVRGDPDYETHWAGVTPTGLCGLPCSSLLSSQRARTATRSGVLLSRAPTFESYILSCEPYSSTCRSSSVIRSTRSGLP
jgi:NAD(P)-dependent dehydrogenase (short-subunit alcohol dehydrogenase family)